MNEQQRSIVHMDLDTFFVSCERLEDSRLNGLPILIGGASDRGVVASCSYEARRFGIHSAMPMKMARERCPEAIVISGNSANYTKYSRMVTDIIQEAVPVVEKSSIDEFYMDHFVVFHTAELDHGCGADHIKNHFLGSGTFHSGAAGNEFRSGDYFYRKNRLSGNWRGWITDNATCSDAVFLTFF